MNRTPASEPRRGNTKEEKEEGIDGYPIVLEILRKDERRLRENTRRGIQRTSDPGKENEMETNEEGFDGYPTVLEILGKIRGE